MDTGVRFVHGNLLFSNFRKSDFDDSGRGKINENAATNHSSIRQKLEMRYGSGASPAMRYHTLVAIDDIRSIQ
ncbi:MAG TPA: hypothetical protein DC001_03160 [Clostridiales bacterium]|nr:hypothetical protein [Clostridiales bacterium]